MGELKRVFITGGTGFIGANLTRLILEENSSGSSTCSKRLIRLLVRPGADRRNLPHHPDVEVHEGDLRDPVSVQEGVTGCDEVFHVAADYRLWVDQPQEIYDSNVTGTEHLLKSAQNAGVKKFVHTSTVGTIGLDCDQTPANESTPHALEQFNGHYKKSKLMAEELATCYANRGLPVVIVNPSTPIGAWDRKPTPTGKIIVDFVNGRLPAYLNTGLNFVHVRDVARGHLLAADRGTVGERYILGDRNLRMIDFLKLIACEVGSSSPKIRIPYAMAWIAGQISTFWSDIISRREPRIPIEGVRMAKHFMYFDSSKAERELGWRPCAFEESISEAVTWFAENGYFQTNPKTPLKDERGVAWRFR